ncbi:GFA family protein [Roseospira marina]|uniref:GFA family protein n=1 Tax=Roseospira marina TaxID=140057 RepID=A0A5M6I7B1_9PROT|nr:GFA family protein [Roseospira marina]KAA5603725.1 GFA family protein [Roseospira marina]MBB4316115.1 hypothetical protein [Roseospira marina]MBB5089313.1 hypothetical protein [Roseospira marina]
MRLEGSCHCGAVTFQVASAHPYPFNLCYCSICRKTAGTGGHAVNIAGAMESLTVTGEDHITVYQARIRDAETGARTISPARRHFCKTCGTALWLWDPRWPELVHPHAGAIDTPLPTPPERTHLMLDDKPDWVPVPDGPNDRHHGGYPDESLAAWHDRLGLAR